MTCPSSASASGRSTTPAPTLSTTPSRLVTVCSTAPAVRQTPADTTHAQPVPSSPPAQFTLAPLILRPRGAPAKNMINPPPPVRVRHHGERRNLGGGGSEEGVGDALATGGKWRIRQSGPVDKRELCARGKGSGQCQKRVRRLLPHRGTSRQSHLPTSSCPSIQLSPLCPSIGPGIFFPQWGELNASPIARAPPPPKSQRLSHSPRGGG